MSSVETDPTTSMVAEQAIVAAATAVISAGGLNATVSGAQPADPSAVTDDTDVAFLIRYGANDAAIVFSEELVTALASESGDQAEDPDGAAAALSNLASLGARATNERLAAIADGVGAADGASLLTSGLGALGSGVGQRVDVQVSGVPAGWLMWIGSTDLMTSLSPRGSSAAVIDAIDYPDLGPGTPPGDVGADISFLSDVTMGVTVELGRTVMRVREVLQLTQGSVVELDRAAGALVDVLISGSVVARGEVVVIDDQLGVRVVEIVEPSSSSR